MKIVKMNHEKHVIHVCTHSRVYNSLGENMEPMSSKPCTLIMQLNLINWQVKRTYTADGRTCWFPKQHGIRSL